MISLLVEMSSNTTDSRKIRAGIRADLVRRLFAVAISVGFATTLVRMNWVISGTWPAESEWGQLSVLLVAMIATVLSWDGYLVSIDQKPLFGFWRFAIDIVLVFVYMFLLISSHHRNWWIWILSIIFVLYVAWDILTVREHIMKYDPNSTSGNASLKQILQIYIGGFLDKGQISRGPITSLSWAIYFIVLAFLNLGSAPYKVFVMAVLAGAGLIGYRQDKASVPGYAMSFRLRLMASGIVIATLYRGCFYLLSS